MQFPRPLHNGYRRGFSSVPSAARRPPLAALLVALAVGTGMGTDAANALDAGPPRHAEVHPQDGPHVDLRIEIGETDVAFEVVVNLAFADELVPPARENLDVLHPVEHAALESSLRGRFDALVGVVAEGDELTSSPGVFEVYEPDPALMGLFPVYGSRALTQIRVHWSHTLPAEFDTVEIRWDAFPMDTAERRLGATGPREVLARLSAGGVQSVITFREGEGVFRWSASGSPEDHLLPVPEFTPIAATTFPLLATLLGAGALALLVVRAAGPLRRRVAIAAVLAIAAFATRGVGRLTLEPGEPLPDADTARAIFEPLHRNIYRAFDYTEESDVYDALARCVEGDLLDRLYTEIYASLREEEAGGAVGSVQELRWVDVEPQDIEREESPSGVAFGVNARWQVEGAVFHWGHAHWRVQELAARYRVRQTEAGWRIVESQVEEQVLLHAGQRLPGADGPRDGPGDDWGEIPDEL